MFLWVLYAKNISISHYLYCTMLLFLSESNTDWIGLINYVAHVEHLLASSNTLAFNLLLTHENTQNHELNDDHYCNTLQPLGLSCAGISWINDKKNSTVDANLALLNPFFSTTYFFFLKANTISVIIAISDPYRGL